LGRLIRTSSTASTTSAFISLTTALYLFPLIPNLFGIIDQNIRDSIKQNEDSGKAKLLTFMAFCAMRFATALCYYVFGGVLADTDMTEEQAIEWAPSRTRLC
jgi:hypothetical protein